MNKLLLVFLMLASINSFADTDNEAFVGYGVGVFNDANYYLGQNKYFNAGYRDFLWDGIYWQTKAGYWGEGSPDATRKSSFFGSSGLGFEVDPGIFEVRSGWALAAITNTDSQLGSHFPQFNGNLALGVRDSKGDGVALEYNHISNASVLPGPNAGRDFVILELSQKW